MRSRRVAALYDIHGNVRALEAVLSEVSAADVDLIVVGGDVASGPWPRETLEVLRNVPSPALFVRGNADRELLEWTGPAPDGDVWEQRTAWVAERLTGEDRKFLGSFTLTEIVAVERLGDVLFCHATPRSDEPILTPLSEEERARALLGEAEQETIVCGHTHVQFDVRKGGKRLVNAGSVGMPYEGRTGAFWTIIGPDVAFRHTSYDVATAAEEIRNTDFPGAAEFADEYVETSYPRDEAMREFEALAAERDRES